ncbi:MAG: AzlC family ABC transporter permease [Neomegalonema sp.]
MSGSSRGFWDGVVASLPVMLAVGPFGMIFGVIATEAGLNLLETMAMTTIVIAGASQLAALQLMTDNAPVALAILTGAVVNLRMAMYSAAIASQWRGAPLWARAFAAYFLHDQSFALSMRRYAEQPAEPQPGKIAFFFGVGVTTVIVWVGASYVGALAGSMAPPEWRLDFAVPVTFIAAVAPLLRSAPQLAAAMTAIVASLVLAPLPFNLGLIVASALGIAAGATLETIMARRAAA